MKIARKASRRPQETAKRHATRRRRGVALATEGLFRAGAGSSGLAQATLRSERDRRLEEVVLTTWAALNAGHPVECPVCQGPLTAADGCSNCGSRLS